MEADVEVVVDLLRRHHDRAVVLGLRLGEPVGQRLDDQVERQRRNRPRRVHLVEVQNPSISSGPGNTTSVVVTSNPPVVCAWTRGTIPNAEVASTRLCATHPTRSTLSREANGATHSRIFGDNATSSVARPRRGLGRASWCCSALRAAATRSRRAVATPTRSSSADAAYIVDCGEGAHRQMWRAGLGAEPRLRPRLGRWCKAIFLTHLPRRPHHGSAPTSSWAAGRRSRRRRMDPLPAGLPIPIVPAGPRSAAGLPGRAHAGHAGRDRPPAARAFAYNINLRVLDEGRKDVTQSVRVHEIGVQRDGFVPDIDLGVVADALEHAGRVARHGAGRRLSRGRTRCDGERHPGAARAGVPRARLPLRHAHRLGRVLRRHRCVPNNVVGSPAMPTSSSTRSSTSGRCATGSCGWRTASRCLNHLASSHSSPEQVGDERKGRRRASGRALASRARRRRVLERRVGGAGARRRTTARCSAESTSTSSRWVADSSGSVAQPSFTRLADARDQVGPPTDDRAGVARVDDVLDVEGFGTAEGRAHPIEPSL